MEIPHPEILLSSRNSTEEKWNRICRDCNSKDYSSLSLQILHPTGRQNLDRAHLSWVEGWEKYDNRCPNQSPIASERRVQSFLGGVIGEASCRIWYLIWCLKDNLVDAWLRSYRVNARGSNNYWNIPLEWPSMADAPKCMFQARKSGHGQPRDLFLVSEELLSPRPV